MIIFKSIPVRFQSNLIGTDPHPALCLIIFCMPVPSVELLPPSALFINIHQRQGGQGHRKGQNHNLWSGESTVMEIIRPGFCFQGLP